MLTEFGKEIRKLRIEQGELLKDMADWLGVTSSYLSAIEHGKKPIPQNLVFQIADHYRLTPDQKEQLEGAAEKSVGSITLNLVGKDEQRLKFANAFARRFDNLTDDEIQELMELLGDD